MLTAILCASLLGNVPERYLNTLAIVESGDNPKAVGRLGERGRYQALPKVLKARSGKSKWTPWEIEHYSRLEIEARYAGFCNRYGRPPSAREFSNLWMSPSKVMKPNAVVHERGKRFEALVNAQ